MIMTVRKDKRISVRVPAFYLNVCTEKGINISYVCRQALFLAIKQHENMPIQGKLRSKSIAAAQFNELKRLRLREETPEFHEKICEMSYKTVLFKHFFMPRADQKELVSLAGFLDQGNFAEDVLQDVYKNEA